jgi:FMN phosphatase YigB (HAD superfamily)
VKYLAVDIGNVICNVDFGSFTQELSQILNVSIDDINYFLNRTNRLHDLGLTCIADELRDHFKIHSPVIISKLIIHWNEVIIGNIQMLSFLNDALKQQTKIALLSNIGVEHASLMRHILTPTIYDRSIKFFSCEAGARKPNFIYYKTFLDMYPEFKNCLYLDDRIENVEAGQKFGFNAMRFALDKISPADISNKIVELQSLI